MRRVPNVLAVLYILFFFVSGVLAQPAPVSISGNISTGPLTISGSNFGAKSPAAPLLFEDFESGTNGNYVAPNNGWVEYAGSGLPSHKYTTSSFHGGSKSSVNTSEAREWFRTIGRTGLNSDTVYISLWTKWVHISGGAYTTGHPVGKFFRLNSQPDFYTSRPSLYYSVGYGSPVPPANNWCYAGVHNGVVAELGQTDLGLACPDDGEDWGRHETYMVLSDPGIANGQARTWWNGLAGLALHNVITRETGFAGQHLDNFLLPQMHDESGGAQEHRYSFYTDDVYVDITQARVEVCSGSTWASKGHCEPQIPSAWSSTSITVTINRGSFPSLSNQYLYVVDSTGAANSNGLLITGGGGSPATVVSYGD